MHKIEELYFRNEFDEENELNLFEPECIITDNPLSIKDDNFLLLKTENEYDRNDFQDISFNEDVDFNYTRYHSDTKDCNINAEFNASQNVISIHNYGESNLTSSEQMLDLEHIQMHSIFTPEKRNKPKEVFTKCHNCEKFVIIRMCPETGDYSKCKYCFNSPFSNELNASDVVSNVSEVPNPIIPVLKPRKEPVVNYKPEASFKCEYCGKLFTRNWYLKQHIKLHSNQKPFACNHCDKRFLNSSNLKQHLKTHSVEYRCCLCDKTYINIESLKLHAQKHTTDPSKQKDGSTEDSDRIITCSYCSERFSSYDALKEHALNHTKDMPFQCDKCDKGFRYNGTLLKHKKIHENEANNVGNHTKEKHETVQQ